MLTNPSIMILLTKYLNIRLDLIQFHAVMFCNNKNLRQNCTSSLIKLSLIYFPAHLLVRHFFFFTNMNPPCWSDVQVLFHDVVALTQKLFPIVEAMQKHFSAGSGAYYSDAIFFLSVAMHHIMPESKKSAFCHIY